MPTTVNDGEFLTYSKYNELKGYFGTDKKNMPIYVKLSDIFPNTNIKEEDQKKYHSAFSELLRHINNGHVFYNYNKEGCWYMSYILYKEVDRVLTHDYDTYVYKLLQEFILKFNQHYSSKSNTCIKEFSHINSDTYKIMNELYTLYDEYTKYKNISKYNIPNNCENFSNFIHLYNIFLNSYVSGTDFFNEILKHFDTEIRKSITNYDIYECKKYPYHLSKLNLYTRPEPKQPIDPVPLEQQQTPNVLARAGLQNSHHDVAHPPVTQLGEARREEAEQENQVAEGKQETAYGQKLTRNNVIPPEQGRVFKPEGAHKAESSREHGITHGYRSTYNHRGEEETLRAGLSPYSQAFATPGSSVHQELSDVSSFSPKLDIKTEDDGVFANVRSTITNVLGQVEPAPILGVSGGMGALFLLFKYTPVGSFFGGRRGRIRQIPSSFRGFPPGDFANFQEYDGGFIGYGPTSISSLAE